MADVPALKQRNFFAARLLQQAVGQAVNTIAGLAILVGASRKRFISTVTPSEPQQRLGGSIAAHLIAAQNGAKIIRAHDVAETVQALRVAAAIEEKQ